MRKIKLTSLVFLLFAIACNNNPGANQNTMITLRDTGFAKGTYGYDAAFLKKHAGNIIELQNDGAKILLSPGYQGRVFTSTASGD
ncbi:MAG: DUF6786 family protein, partial [Parafilimonas sp.]